MTVQNLFLINRFAAILNIEYMNENLDMNVFKSRYYIFVTGRENKQRLRICQVYLIPQTHIFFALIPANREKNVACFTCYYIINIVSNLIIPIGTYFTS